MALRADDVDVARDRALVDQFQTGEVRAFEDLYNRYFDRVRRSCLRQVGDAYDAEEIAQEVFARAYVAFPNLGGPRHAYACLSVVASRLCVDTHRRRARTQPAAEVERVEISLDPAPRYDDAGGSGGAARTDISPPQTTDFDAARRNAENEPTHASNDLVAVGVDPDELVNATVGSSEPYAEQATDWISRRLP